MNEFKILKYGEKADSLYGIENKEITELELEALLEGKRLWTDINCEYAITIRLKERLNELDIDRENKRLNNIIEEAREEVRIYEEQSKDGITNELDNYVFVQRLKNVLNKGEIDD